MVEGILVENLLYRCKGGLLLKEEMCGRVGNAAVVMAKRCSDGILHFGHCSPLLTSHFLPQNTTQKVPKPPGFKVGSTFETKRPSFNRLNSLLERDCKGRRTELVTRSKLLKTKLSSKLFWCAIFDIQIFVSYFNILH